MAWWIPKLPLQVGDVDDDGDADFLISGWEGSSKVTRLFTNASGVFSEVTAASTTMDGVDYNGDIKMMNIDADADLEFFIAGKNQDNLPIFKVYDDNFNALNFLDGFENCDMELADADDDGDIDVLIAGMTSGVKTTRLYTNQSGAYIQDNIFPGLNFTGDIKMANVDLDDELEFIIAGLDQSNSAILNVYDHDYSQISQLDNFENCKMDLADVDADGDLDILITGVVAGNKKTKLFAGDIPVGIADDVQANVVRIYPNPANNAFTVKLSDIDVAEFSIVNTLGQTVHTENITNGKKNIELGLPSGTYLLEVIAEEGKFRKPIIIQGK